MTARRLEAVSAAVFFIALWVAPRARAVEWRRFGDPTEAAFTIELPAGWRRAGGIVRTSSLDVRPWARATSPDGGMDLFFGDSQVPTFIHTSPQMLAWGYREGAWYSPRFNERFLVAPYRPGSRFAAFWGRSRLCQVCDRVSLVRARDLPAASRRLGEAYGGDAAGAQTVAGEAEFTCARGPAAYIGYFFTATQLPDASEHGIWSAKVMAGFIAPAARAPEAAELLTRMAQSFEMQPAWVTRMSAADGDIGRIVTGSAVAISESVTSAFHQRH